MCSAGCGRLRIDGRAVRGDRECCPKRRDNVGGPVPELIAPLPPGLPVVPGVRRARDQPWWMGRPILVSVLSFFRSAFPTRHIAPVAGRSPPTVPAPPIWTKPVGVANGRSTAPLRAGPCQPPRENQSQVHEELGDVPHCGRERGRRAARVICGSCARLDGVRWPRVEALRHEEQSLRSQTACCAASCHRGDRRGRAAGRRARQEEGRQGGREAEAGHDGGAAQGDRRADAEAMSLAASRQGRGRQSAGMTR